MYIETCSFVFVVHPVVVNINYPVVVVPSDCCFQIAAYIGRIIWSFVCCNHSWDVNFI